ncbi:hypothetical protein NDU88_004948 [Pleurodeles waltl]|uniref:Uncharacterized protein n=1 Tax=Pleurodeles waltl TaxID=8319 RepID=A0AAV7MFH1_PLEWA|nr:hypothetical protein NDU88_004948 [Pleurodeles waltl]
MLRGRCWAESQSFPDRTEAQQPPRIANLRVGGPFGSTGGDLASWTPWPLVLTVSGSGGCCGCAVKLLWCLCGAQ